MNTGDTIAAISSAVGQAARMIVRLSGPQARAIAAEISSIQPPIAFPGLHDRRVGEAPTPHAPVPSAKRCEVSFRGLHVTVWMYFFESPRSYSGEDVVEFHIPGNPLLARMLLDELISRGARHADAGEFTARAYFNGRMDLAEAEGVAATIAAQNQRELRAARQLLAGELARRLRPILDSLAEALALVEVGIDFSEEDVTFLSASELGERIGRADAALDKLLRESARFEALGHEPRIVLVGRPNAGKSTLLNALCGQERAVVSARAGTTRDAIWSHARLERGIVRIIDVAGLDEVSPSPPPNNEVSTKMQQSARRAIAQADVVVGVRDITDPQPMPRCGVPLDVIVLTKLDLAPATALSEETGTDATDNAAIPTIAVSALTGRNMDALRQRLDAAAFGQPAAGATLALNARHVEAISAAREALHRAGDSVKAGPEIIALELRQALDDLGQVLGSVTPDDVLGRIFAGFCIGK